MTYQEHEHPRGEAGRWETKQQSEPEGVALGTGLPPKPKPVMAQVTLQRWRIDDPDYAEKVGTVEFDAAPILAGIVPTLDQDELEDELSYDTRDLIFEEAVARGIVPRHDGPFEVHVEESLRKALAEDPDRFSAPYPHELVARHYGAVLESPLSPYEMGRRMDDEGRVEAHAVLDIEQLSEQSGDWMWSSISEKLTGHGLVEEPEYFPVEVRDGQVVFRISGNITEFVEQMSDEDRALFDAGLAADAAEAGGVL